MKTLAVAFLALFLVCSAVALDCPSGYYDPTGGATKCRRCPEYFTTCASAVNGTVVSTITGYTTASGLPVSYCSAGAYNKNTNQCQMECKTGCSSCLVDYDFCIDCQNGYLWNTDHTCLPAVIGLSAASLALLAVGLIFGIIGCCYVNKARK